MGRGHCCRHFPSANPVNRILLIEPRQQVIKFSMRPFHANWRLEETLTGDREELGFAFRTVVPENRRMSTRSRPAKVFELDRHHFRPLLLVGIVVKDWSSPHLSVQSIEVMRKLVHNDVVTITRLRCIEHVMPGKKNWAALPGFSRTYLRLTFRVF